MKFEVTGQGELSKTFKFLGEAQNIKSRFIRILERYGTEGVAALAAETPVSSGLTASDWNYKVVSKLDTTSLIFTNSNTIDGVPIVILLQYGHATRNGGYVQGRDFINPAIQPIFDKIAMAGWEEVRSL